MSFPSRVEELKQSIRYRDRILIALLVLLIIMALGWMQAPKQITVYQPPDPSLGLLSKPGDIPKTTVYGFVRSVIDVVYLWNENGEVDFKNNIDTYAAFFTPAYRADLLADYETRRNEGELKDRVRTTVPVEGLAYSDKRVEQLSKDAWIVYVDYDVTETVNAEIVKDIKVRYPVRVVRANISQNYNPYQLQIDGYASPGPSNLLTNETEGL